MNTKDFRKELGQLLNRASRENESDTPDYLLAGFLLGCLESYEKTVRDRDHWFDFKPWGKKAMVELELTDGAPPAALPFDPITKR